jgi:hypothetical protein
MILSTGSAVRTTVAVFEYLRLLFMCITPVNKPLLRS